MMETKLVVQGRHVYNVTLAAKLRVVADIFSTSATQYHGQFSLLSAGTAWFIGSSELSTSATQYHGQLSLLSAGTAWFIGS